MDLTAYIKNEGEKPLDNIVADGGFFKIFRKVACIGDSLSSGEFESCDENGDSGYHDMFEYSWGQYMAREAGVEVLNFSRGGMSAKEYIESFADKNNFWSEDRACQAYIIALGVNDILNQGQEIGSIDDIKLERRFENATTFAGYYGRIIQNLKKIQPDAKFFLMTMPKEKDGEELKIKHAELLYDMAKLFKNTYVIDLYKYAPEYNDEFKRNFFLAGHLNPQGYILTAKMVMSYIDYIIRNNPEDFAQVPFIGKPYRNLKAKW